MKANKKFWAALVIFSFIGQVAWVVENMYFNVFIYKMFNASASDISLMVGASAAAATITTLVVGAFSDKVGKRKLFICLGYILWGITIGAFAFIRTDIISAVFPAVSASAVGVSLVIIMDCVMTFFGSSANDACFNAWVTESTDEGTRGKAEGINSMMPLVAILAVFGGFMGFNQDESSTWVIIYLIIGGVVILAGIAGLFLIDDTKVDVSENKSYFKNILYGFRPSVIKSNVFLYICLIGFCLFNISIQIYMPYLILYYSVSLALDSYVLIMAPAIILASVFTFFYGRVYDRIGFSRAVIAPIALLCSGYILLFAFKSVPLVFIGSLLMMAGYLSGMSVFGAVIRDHTPENKTGMFQGLRIFSQVCIPGIVGPAIGAFVLRNADKFLNSDGTESFIPNENIFLAALIAAAVLIAFLLVIKLVYKNNKREGV